LGSPFAFRFAGTRDAGGVGTGSRDSSLDASLAGVGFGTFRGFATAETGVGCGGGSALESMLENDIGSAGLLGAWRYMLDKLFEERILRVRTDIWVAVSVLIIGSCLITASLMFVPLCRATGEAAELIMGDRDIDGWRCGWAWEMGDRGGKFVFTGEVYDPL
jgi:hypothetical protein